MFCRLQMQHHTAGPFRTCCRKYFTKSVLYINKGEWFTSVLQTSNATSHLLSCILCCPQQLSEPATFVQRLPNVFQTSWRFFGTRWVVVTSLVQWKPLSPWLSMYIQGLLLNEEESLIPNDCHCGEPNCTGYDLNILV